MDREKTEFRNFTQGNKTVEAYQREFLNPSRYAKEHMDTDAHGQKKFRSGLHPDLKLSLVVHDFFDVATLANKAITVETSQMEHKVSPKHSHDMGSSSGSAQKRRI